MDLARDVGEELHVTLAAARQAHRTAIDAQTGGTIALRYDDCEHLAHDRRIEGIGLTCSICSGSETECCAGGTAI